MNASGLAPPPLFTLEELGLDRRVTLEQASRALAHVAEAEIVRRVRFRAGFLFFTLASGGSGVRSLVWLDRKTGGFYRINFKDRKWGGSSLRGLPHNEMIRQHHLTTPAEPPTLLERLSREAARAKR